MAHCLGDSAGLTDIDRIDRRSGVRHWGLVYLNWTNSPVSSSRQVLTSLSHQEEDFLIHTSTHLTLPSVNGSTD